MNSAFVSALAALAASRLAVAPLKRPEPEPAQTYQADENTAGLSRGERKRLKRDRKRREKFAQRAALRAQREYAE